MRNKIFTILLTITVVILVTVLIKEKFSKKDSVIAPVVKEAVRADVENISKKIDRQGFEHAVISDKENVIRLITELDTSAIRELDSVKKLLDIKDKQLLEYRQYTVRIEKKLAAIKTDTGFRYADKWTNIEYVKPIDTTSPGHFNFTYDAEINHAEYWKKKHILAPKQHYIDFWISDPRATINKVKRVKFEVKEPYMGIEVNASSFYTDRLNMGIDGSIRFGRTHLGGGYFYDFNIGKWRPLVTAKFRLLEF